MRLPVLFSVLLLLATTGCSEATSPGEATEIAAKSGQTSVDMQIDSVVVNSSCTLVLGAYEQWEMLDAESNLGAPGKIARENFALALETVLLSAVELYGLEALLEINNELDGQEVSYSDGEALAGIAVFWINRRDNPSFDLEKVQPGRHVSFDNAFDSQIKRRCEVREGSAEAEAAESVKADILSLSVYSSYEEAIDAFVAQGGPCDRILDELYCQSNDEEFQASFWIWDEPRLELPEADATIDIVVGRNWELWINPELELDLDSIAEGLGGIVIR